MRHRLIPLVLALLPLLVPADSAAGREGGPNVVFILADDLGRAEVGAYGQEKIRTPSIDKIAAEGMRFTRFYAGSPVCAPSRCALLTGKHSGHAFIRDNREIKPEGQAPIPDSEVTLAEMFKAKGYATAAVGKWGLGFPGSEGDPMNQGFDHFFGYNCQREAHNYYPDHLWNDRERVDYPGNPGGPTGERYSHDLMEKDALNWLRDHRDRPFFLFLPFTIPHLALQVPADSLAEYDGKFGDETPYDGKKGYQPQAKPRAAYAAMVTRMDRTVGRVMDLLRELKLDDDTIVVFASDNGPTFKTGGADSDFFDSAGGLRGLKGSAYEGGIAVPFIVRWPGRVAPGTTCDRLGYFPDVPATFMDLIGGSDALPDGLDGISFAPALLGKSNDQKDHVFMYWEFPGYGGQQAVRLGQWKGVRQNMRKGDLSIRLFDIDDDPTESHDVAADHPEVVARVEAVMKEEHVPSRLFPLPAVDTK